MLTAACAAFTMCGHRPRMLRSPHRELWSSLHLFVSHICPGIGVSRKHAYRARCIARHAGPSHKPSTNRLQTVLITNRARHLRNSSKPYKPYTNRHTNRAPRLRNSYKPYKPLRLGFWKFTPWVYGLYGLYEFLKHRARLVGRVVDGWWTVVDG